MKVDIRVGEAVAAARGRFEYLASSAFPRAAEKMGDYLASELANKMEHAVRRGHR